MTEELFYQGFMIFLSIVIGILTAKIVSLKKNLKEARTENNNLKVSNTNLKYELQAVNKMNDTYYSEAKKNLRILSSLAEVIKNFDTNPDNKAIYEIIEQKDKEIAYLEEMVEKYKSLAEQQKRDMENFNSIVDDLNRRVRKLQDSYK